MSVKEKHFPDNLIYFSRYFLYPEKFIFTVLPKVIKYMEIKNVTHNESRQERMKNVDNSWDYLFSIACNRRN